MVMALINSQINTIMDSSPQDILAEMTVWRAFEEEPVMAHFVKMWPDSLGVFWSDERIVFSEDCVFCVRDVYALDDH